MQIYNLHKFYNLITMDNHSISVDHQESFDPSRLVQPHVYYRTQTNLSRGRQYKKRIYYCKGCKLIFDNKFNALRHQKIKRHNENFIDKQLLRQNINNNNSNDVAIVNQPERVQSKDWVADIENVTELVRSIIYPYVSGGVKVKNYMLLAKQIITPMKDSIVELLSISLASALQNIFAQNDDATIQINSLKKNILNLLSNIDFKKSIVDFGFKLKEVHEKMQSKVDKHTRTYQNNQAAFQKFFVFPEITFRNAIKFQQFSVSLNRFQQKNCKRYWGLLRKMDAYFSQFPEMRIINQIVIKRLREIPKSFDDICHSLKIVIQEQPGLASDMWTIMSLGLRRTDFHKIQLWSPEGQPGKFIKIIENKNQNITTRFIPSSVLKLAVYARSRFPMTKERIKKAVSKCLELFKTCYGFKHRVITSTISALMSSNNFLHFHRTPLTTIKYYLQPEDQAILDRALNHGIIIDISAQDQLKIQQRSLIIDASRYPAYSYIGDKAESSISLSFDSTAQDRAISSIADEGKVNPQQISQYHSIHVGQLAYVSKLTNHSIEDEPEYNYIQQCIGSVIDADQYEVIENFVEEQSVKDEKSRVDMYLEGLATATGKKITYLSFNMNEVEPVEKLEFNKEQDQQIIISSVTRNRKEVYHVINDTNEQKIPISNRLRKKNRMIMEDEGQIIIYKRQPNCKQCQSLGRIRLLQTKNNTLACNYCGYYYQYNIPVRVSQKVKFISTSNKQFNKNVCCFSKTKKVNNLRATLGQNFAIKPIYTSTIPQIVRCSFHNFQGLADEITSFRKTIEKQPLQIRDSTITGAGKGLFTTEKLREGTIVGVYIGLIGHSFQLDENSDSLFQIGWYKYEEAYCFILCDGKIVNDGSRYINTNSQSKCNTHGFLGIFQQQPIILILTNRQVEKEEELFLDYGKNYLL